MCIKSRIPKAKQQATKTQRVSYYDAFKSTYAARSLSDQSINYQTVLQFSTKEIEPASNKNGYHSQKSIKQYQIEDVQFLQLNCTCQKVTGQGMVGCKGNEMTICYHSMASIIKAAELKGQTVVFFNNFSEAFNYSNFGGKLIRVKSLQALKTCWIVVRGK